MLGWVRERPGGRIDRSFRASEPRTGDVAPGRSSPDVATAVAPAVPSTPWCGLDGATPDRDDRRARDWAATVRAAPRSAARTAGWFARGGRSENSPTARERARDDWPSTWRTRAMGGVMEADDGGSRGGTGTPAPEARYGPTVTSRILAVPAVAALPCSRRLRTTMPLAREIRAAVGAGQTRWDPLPEAEGPAVLRSVEDATDPGPLPLGRLPLLHLLALRLVPTSAVGPGDRRPRLISAAPSVSSSRKCFGRLSVRSPLRCCSPALWSTVPAERSVFFDRPWERRRAMAAGDNQSRGAPRRWPERRRRMRGRGDGSAGVVRSGLVDSVGFGSVLGFRIGRVVIRRRMTVDESGSLRSCPAAQVRSMTERSPRWPSRGRRRGSAAVNGLGWPGAAVCCRYRANSTRPASDSYERSVSSRRALLGLAAQECKMSLPLDVLQKGFTLRSRS